MRILFILKNREQSGSYGSWNYSGGGLSSGLHNSASFMVDMLNGNGVETKLVHVADNNCIDREISLFKPNVVVIEAYWVVPEKFDVLMPLHPGVKWVVRDHSKSEFLASEGMAFGWTIEYMRRGIEIAVNSPEAFSDMQAIAKAADISRDLVSYMPNFYPMDNAKLGTIPFRGRFVNVGCFGAIRPLKNHMVQAIAAMRFADLIGKKLHFHVNGTRVEGGASPILKNLRETFAKSHHVLVEHEWMEHVEFLALVGTMDVSLQCSFSETFNIVSADAVSQGVPTVVSRQVPWVEEGLLIADPSNSNSIFLQLMNLYDQRQYVSRLTSHQRAALYSYSAQSEYIWLNRITLRR